jgi:Na+/proline symporter
MGVIMGGMFLAFYYVIGSFPEGIGFSEGFDIAGCLGKMEIIDLSPDLSNKYTLLSGLTGGLFLFVSYFGTDQSQVQRYLGGKSLKQSRMGLMFNGLLKIPMQFFILLIGVMVFVSFQFNKPPIVFNPISVEMTNNQKKSLLKIETEYDAVFNNKKQILSDLQGNIQSESNKEINELQVQQDSLRSAYKNLLFEIDPAYETKDSDYIFLTFILNFLPHGLIGLLLAVIFSAAMSSTAGELNALSATTTIDYYKKFWSKSDDEKKDLKISKLLTVSWGILAIIIALTAGMFENLIQLVNILGSLFYGTILGVFILALFFKFVGGKAALIGGIVGQLTVLLVHFLQTFNIIELSYLMYNFIGCAAVIIIGVLIQKLLGAEKKKSLE